MNKEVADVRHALRVVVILCSIIVFQSHRVASITIKYMEFPAVTQGDTLSLPITLNLPSYGHVRVSIAPMPPGATLPPVTFFHQDIAENQSPQNQPTYSWGTDTNRFNVFSGNTHIYYVVTFTFLDGAPDASRLILVVVGLAEKTNATVSTSPASSPGNLLGEFHFPPSQDLPNGSSTTRLKGAQLSSEGDGDSVNTGWALYQPQATATLTSLSVSMDQPSGDGVGWTLAYISEGQAEPVPTLSSAALILLGILIAAIALRFVRLRLS